MNKGTVVIFGGTGFVGHQLVARLAKQGWEVRIPTRRPHRHRDLLVYPGVHLHQLNQLNDRAMRTLSRGCDAAINLIGILNESSKASFQDVHVKLSRRILSACLDSGVPRLLHMSALHADAARGASRYLRSKGEAENMLLQVDHKKLHVTAFRPSVIFGSGDSFFNRFARLLRYAPGFMPLACPGATFAPVFVGDVTAAFAEALQNRETFGRRYDLCGPHEYTLQQLVEYTARLLGYRVRVVPLGDGISRMQARILQKLPGKLFTLDNYQSMQVASVCSGKFPEVFHCKPTAIESVVPEYLIGRSQHGRNSELRRSYENL